MTQNQHMQWMDEIAERLANTTPGEWKCHGYAVNNMFGPYFARGPHTTLEQCAYDAEFITFAKRDMGRLIACVNAAVIALKDIADKREDSNPVHSMRAISEAKSALSLIEGEWPWLSSKRNT